MQARRKNGLEDFNRQINLTEYAAAQGYVFDRKASTTARAPLQPLASIKG
jgi:hypothetical protein